MPTRKKSAIKEIPTEPAIEAVIEPEPLEEKTTETFTFKATHFYAVMVVAAFSVGVILGYLIWGRAPASQTAAAQNSGDLAQAPATAAPQYVRYKIPTDGFPSLGPADAPITIVEFGDFECPFCREWQQQTYQPLFAAYPGKIRFVFRDFPLTSIHPDAEPAAEAAQCANEQNAFWPFHDKLFSSSNLGDAVYQQYAQELGLNMDQFNQCYSSHKYQQAIQNDSNFAVNLGVNSTPTFFINGLAVIGAQPIDVFKQIIDKELAGEIPNN
jgi:protein-disulfide isomerase